MAGLAVDETDLRILRCLAENAMLSHKELGELVHMTGQAVGARIRKLEDAGVIEGYAARIDRTKLGLALTAFVTVFLKSGSAHEKFLAFAAGEENVEEVHRVSGEGCYWLRTRAAGHDDLNRFLDRLLEYGNYKLSLSIGKLKG
ncbi:Lrp/AsnC family transcriptional regulator [Cohnella sp.]|uniref:Lrp/AsnC family transcriptional regulator n=1 Tax=Cohnella sp. TaxID=1883426 RepID=UPI003562734D